MAYYLFEPSTTWPRYTYSQALRLSDQLHICGECVLFNSSYAQGLVTCSATWLHHLLPGSGTKWAHTLHLAVNVLIISTMYASPPKPEIIIVYLRRTQPKWTNLVQRGEFQILSWAPYVLLALHTWKSTRSARRSSLEWSNRSTSRQTARTWSRRCYQTGYKALED